MAARVAEMLTHNGPLVVGVVHAVAVGIMLGGEQECLPATFLMPARRFVDRFGLALAGFFTGGSIGRTVLQNVRESTVLRVDFLAICEILKDGQSTTRDKRGGWSR